MNRLQKKCFFAASGMHGLLALILLIGPAFLSANNKSENVPELDFVPFKTVDALVSGGGDPKGGMPPPPAPPAPTVTPVKPEVVEKAPPPEPVKPVVVKEVTQPKKDPDSLELPKKHKPVIEVSTKTVVRNFDRQAAAKAAAKARAATEAKAAAENNRRLASALRSAATSIEGGLSGSTSIVLKGPGGGGVPYGNWLSAVKQRYTQAWVVPDGVTDDSATVMASVTIARNGEVLSSNIVRLSGNSLVDHSVKATLDRVTTAPPLPDGAKEDQRTVTINFNVKAKLGQG